MASFDNINVYSTFFDGEDFQDHSLDASLWSGSLAESASASASAALRLAEIDNAHRRSMTAGESSSSTLRASLLPMSKKQNMKNIRSRSVERVRNPASVPLVVTTADTACEDDDTNGKISRSSLNAMFPAPANGEGLKSTNSSMNNTPAQRMHSFTALNSARLDNGDRKRTSMKKRSSQLNISVASHTSATANERARRRCNASWSSQLNNISFTSLNSAPTNEEACSKRSSRLLRSFTSIDSGDVAEILGSSFSGTDSFFGNSMDNSLLMNPPDMFTQWKNEQTIQVRDHAHTKAPSLGINEFADKGEDQSQLSSRAQQKIPHGIMGDSANKTLHVNQNSIPQLSGDIIDAFRDDQHDASVNDAPLISQNDLFPSPLSPEVEQRHKKANVAAARDSLEKLLCDDDAYIAIEDGCLSEPILSPIREIAAKPQENDSRQHQLHIEHHGDMKPQAIERPRYHSISEPSVSDCEINQAYQAIATNVSLCQEQVFDLNVLPTATVETEVTGINSQLANEAKTAAKLTDVEPKKSTQRSEGNKRKSCKDHSPPESENVTLVGMGFFSQLEENGLYDVKGVTEIKKKVIRRRRKPKPDLLQNVSMGFFSSQIDSEPPEARPKRRLVETAQARDFSEQIAPLYDWAPTVDERTRFALEYSLPIVLPGVAILSKFTTPAFIYCVLLPVGHTLETILTDFGPKASDLRLKNAPITPMMHMCLDLLILLPLIISAFVWPQLYGPHAYTQGAVLIVLSYVYWAAAYKDVVLRRRAVAKII